MDKIPPQAVPILELIRITETSRADATAYDTVYGHNEAKLTKPITTMTVDEVQHWQPGFTKNFGSSATGAYQFMYATLKDLKQKHNLSGSELMNGELQDWLGYQLLIRRGYLPWVESRSTTDTFMVGLAKEWASFPVPSRMKGQKQTVERGQSYYAGDLKNKALIKPDKVWLACEAARDNIMVEPEPEPKPPKPEEPTEETDLDTEELVMALELIGKLLSNPEKRDAVIAALLSQSA